MIFRSFSQSESHVTTAERSFSPQQCRGPPGAGNQIVLRVFCVLNGVLLDETAGLPVVIIHHLCRLYVFTNTHARTHTHVHIYVFLLSIYTFLMLNII